MVLPEARADGHAPGLERIRISASGQPLFPRRGITPRPGTVARRPPWCGPQSSTQARGDDLDDFFDRSRREATRRRFLARMKVGAKLSSTRKPLQPLYRSRVSGTAIAFIVLAALIAIIAAVVLSIRGLTPGTGSAQWDRLVSGRAASWNR